MKFEFRSVVLVVFSVNKRAEAGVEGAFPFPSLELIIDDGRVFLPAYSCVFVLSLINPMELGAWPVELENC